MNYVNLSRIYMEMIRRYKVSTFYVISKMDETENNPAETMLEFYYDNSIPVDIPKMKSFLKRYIRFVDNYFINVEDSKIIICIVFRQKTQKMDYGFEFSLN